MPLIGWSKFSTYQKRTTQIRVVTRHQYGISALVPQKSFRGETSSDVTKCRLFSQARYVIKKNTLVGNLTTWPFIFGLLSNLNFLNAVCNRHDIWSDFYFPHWAHCCFPILLIWKGNFSFSNCIIFDRIMSALDTFFPLRHFVMAIIIHDKKLSYQR